MRDGFTSWAVTVAAVVAVLPAVLPGAELYLDNAPHLVEVRLLAEQVLPGAAWFTGWADGPLAGFAVGELNAPLAWTPLALMVAVGLPVVPLYGLATVGSNVVLGLGMLRLARRVVPSGALVAALLAVSAPADLYGIGGATGGMWPFRLGCGLGLWWWAGPRGLARDAAWLSLILLTHTYPGVMAFGFLLLVRRQHALAPLGLASLVTSGFWVPIAFGGLADALRAPYPWSPLEVAVLHLLPVDVFGWQLGVRALLGGSWSLPWAAVVVFGAAVGLRRGRPGPVPVLAVGGVAAVLLLELALLGPNPWRYLVAWRLGLCLLAARLVPWTLAAVLPVCAFAVGWQESTRCLGEDAAVCGALASTWTELADAAPEGLVFHQDPFWKGDAPGALVGGHGGAMLSVATDLPVIGSWYGVTPIATVGPTASDVGVLFGREEGAMLADPEGLHARFRRLGVGAVVSVTPALADFLDADHRYRRVTRTGPLGAWVLEAPPQQAIGARLGPVTLLEETRGRLLAEVPAGPLRIRRSHHPWWVATIDGVELELERSELGLLTADVPAAGTFELQFTPRLVGSRWLSLLGLVLLVSAGRRAQAADRGGRERYPAHR